MFTLKILYTCVAIAFAPPPIGGNSPFKEAVEMLHCGRTSSREQCERMGREAITRTMNRWNTWGHRSEIGDFEIVCDPAYFEIGKA